MNNNPNRKIINADFGDGIEISSDDIHACILSIFEASTESYTDIYMTKEQFNKFFNALSELRK